MFSNTLLSIRITSQCLAVFSVAVRWNAHSIIVAHNHPSGCSVPSQLDVRLTEALQKAAELMGIPLRDHIVFTDDEYYSFTDKMTH